MNVDMAQARCRSWREEGCPRTGGGGGGADERRVGVGAKKSRGCP